MFAETVGLDDSFDFFFLGRIPTLARARQEASMPGAAGLLCRASGALGIEAVGRTRIGQNEVGRASTKGPLGEPLIGRTRIGQARTIPTCLLGAVPWRVSARLATQTT